LTDFEINNVQSSFITSDLIRMIENQSELSRGGHHHVDHWARVLANGRKLAPMTGANLKIVELFAVFHDSRRFSEGHDPEHGLRGARFAEQMRGTWFEVSTKEMDLLFEACEFHSDGYTEADVTVQTCWDSDRLDLGRVGITPDVRFVCTEAAKRADVLERAYEKSLSNI